MTTIVLYKGVLAVDSCNTKSLQGKNFHFNRTNKIFIFQNEVYFNNTKVIAMSGAGVENSILRMVNYLSKNAVNLEKHFKFISNSLEGDNSSFVFLLETGEGVHASELLDDSGLYQWNLNLIDFNTLFCLGSGYDFVNNLKLSSATEYCEIACKLDEYSCFPLYYVDSNQHNIEINSIESFQKKTLDKFVKCLL